MNLTVLSRRIRSDWAGLLIVLTAVALKGWAYLPFVAAGSDVPAVERWIPTSIAAGLWLAVAAFGIVSVTLRRWGAQFVGCGAALHALWAVMYFSAWLAGQSSRGWVTAILYAAFVAAIMWGFSRRPVQEIELREVRG